MNDKEIERIMQRLKDQALLVKNKNTHHEIFNIMYGFVEIIENHPVFSEFIYQKIKEEKDFHSYLNDARRKGEIDKELWYQKFNVHIVPALYHSCYSLLKAAHDSIKIDKCVALGIKARYIDEVNLMFFSTDNPKFSKPLEKYEKVDYIETFIMSLKKIRELINTDRVLLNNIYKKINNKDKQKDDDEKFFENIEFIYNDVDETGSIYYKDEVIRFKGRRGLILNYFFKKKDKGQINYHNFNKWLKKEEIKDITAESFSFRQDIEEINKRIKKESQYIKSLIKKIKKGKDKPTEINFYKFKVLYKK